MNYVSSIHRQQLIVHPLRFWNGGTLKLPILIPNLIPNYFRLYLLLAPAFTLSHDHDENLASPNETGGPDVVEVGQVAEYKSHLAALRGTEPRLTEPRVSEMRPAALDSSRYRAEEEAKALAEEAVITRSESAERIANQLSLPSVVVDHQGEW